MGEIRQENRNIVQIDELQYTYPGGEKALDGLSLSVTRGEVLSVVGPSGCGKSTLLRLVAGFLEPDAGSISVTAATDGRHRCAMMFQEDTLLPWMRVNANARLYETFQGNIFQTFRRRKQTAKDQPPDTVDRLLEMVDLASVANRFPYELSGGMKRRLSLVMAVASLPQLLLLDEPFSALDEPTRVSIHGQVYSVLRNFNVSSILVTHDIAEALCLSDRVLVLTARPARVAHEFVVPFGAQRDMMALRSSNTFLELYGQVWEQLQKEMPKSGSIDMSVSP